LGGVEMSIRIDQIYVQTPDHALVETLLSQYVKEFANQFVQCSTIRLDGIEQVLSALVRKKHEFRLYADTKWTAIWEVVHRIDFADPSIAKYLSEHTKRESLWIKADEDYNIWAHQIFLYGIIEIESFFPESYFSGDHESEKRWDYGSCIEFADAFNSARNLPLFMESLWAIERNRTISKSFSNCRPFQNNVFKVGRHRHFQKMIRTLLILQSNSFQTPL
jgi:hypothetical protein